MGRDLTQGGRSAPAVRFLRRTGNAHFPTLLGPEGAPWLPGARLPMMAPMALINGTSVSPGLAIGPIHVVGAGPDAIPLWSLRGEDVAHEVQRFHDALEGASLQFDDQQQKVLEAAGEKEAGIFAVHRMVLQDPSALENIETTIRDERINAESAVQSFIAKLQKSLGRLDGANVRQYAEDMSDPWRVVLDVLMANEKVEFASSGERVILAAAQLTPQVVGALDRERILGIVTESGGRFSHGAVLARSIGIPCVVKVPNLLARLEQGMQVMLDGGAGTFVLEPSAEEVDEFLERRQRHAARREALVASAAEPATTPDGHSMGVGVNMESMRDLGTFEREHTDGIGLLRTEFLYMERSEFPSEEEQFRLYRRVVEHMEGRPVTFRTLDIGGDKQLPYFTTPKEANPQLGWRGLRITLEWQDLLRVQLRAALRASAYGNLRLLLPMVTSYEEVKAVHEVFRGVREQLEKQGYEMSPDVAVGIMVEVPSIIYVLEDVIEEVDFICVGTNDLTQYLLAVDRDNPFVADIYDPQHPALIRALKQIADIANAAGKPCGVCGEIAGDYAAALMLLGMGYGFVSVAPNFLAEIRYAVRLTSFAEARQLAERVLEARTADVVREALDETRERLHALTAKS